jgi:cell division protein FtsI/penicillin-binding protein 2
MSPLVVALMAMTAALSLAACGGTSSTPQATLKAFLASWQKRDWTAMKRQVADPPADFTSVNAAALNDLGETALSFSAGLVTRKGSRASAPVTEHFTLPLVGSWDPVTQVKLVQRKGKWLVSWTPATINPGLQHPGDRLLVSRHWPARAGISGAGGVPLVTSHNLVTVGIVGSRVKNPHAVGADLIAAGATQAEVDQALAQAKAHPSEFDPVFQITQARFEQLKNRPGPNNVYSVPGTSFRLTGARTAITAQLTAHVVGSVGPITAQELHQLGPPYDATSQVGQTGLEAAYERRLAGNPSVRIDVADAGGNPENRLKTWPGHRGQSVTTSLDPRIQRAAEAALAGQKLNVAMVAMRASTGQLLAVVSDPVDSFDQALQGAYPPGSTFKVLTSTALIRAGLTTQSPASCPPSATVDGETFHNAEGDSPASTLDAAFTESCNTAFIGLATSHLKAADFTSTARLYGLQRRPLIGVPAFDANVPAPKDQAALAATSIGQAEVTFSPLGMAAVAAAVDSGTVRAPRLVDGAPDDRVATAPLPANVADSLRLMMGHVVESGTAAGSGLPTGTHAKTGTAQYGSGSASALKIDAWLMGWDRDIAFAIVTQNSGSLDGGPRDGPLIAKFLNALGG